MTILTWNQVYALSRSVGCTSAQAVIATAITEPESGRWSDCLGDQSLAPHGSRGLWQIFTGAHSLAELKIASYDELFDPFVNARAMWIVSNRGSTWAPWSTHKNNAYARYLPDARAAATAVGDKWATFLPTKESTVTDAVANATKQLTHPSQSWHEQCLKFVRTMFGLASNGEEPTAYSAWLAEGGADGPNTHTQLPAPANVPAFFKGNGKDGHIVVSAGNGMCLSSDIDDPAGTSWGHVYLVSFAHIESKWGMRYLGWSETLEGQRVHAHVTA